MVSSGRESVKIARLHARKSETQGPLAALVPPPQRLQPGDNGSAERHGGAAAAGAATSGARRPMPTPPHRTPQRTGRHGGADRLIKCRALHSCNTKKHLHRCTHARKAFVAALRWASAVVCRGLKPSHLKRAHPGTGGRSRPGALDLPVLFSGPSSSFQLRLRGSHGRTLPRLMACVPRGLGARLEASEGLRERRGG